MYSNRAANSHPVQTRYDQPIFHLNGGADHAIRPGSRPPHRSLPHPTGSADPLAVAPQQDVERERGADVPSATVAATPSRLRLDDIERGDFQ